MNEPCAHDHCDESAVSLVVMYQMNMTWTAGVCSKHLTIFLNSLLGIGLN